MIAGIQQSGAGNVDLDGVPMTGADWAAWRRGVGLVSQDERVPFATTLRRLIGGLIPPGSEEVWAAAGKALIDEEIATMPMGLQTLVETSNMSTGQQQRLLIAREILRRPSVLILDEATNALPDAIQARLFANLRSCGQTCVLVTHRESAIAQMDRVLVLKDGAIVWSGTPDAMRNEPRVMDVVRAERMEGHL